jgi:hypothetical protein
LLLRGSEPGSKMLKMRGTRSRKCGFDIVKNGLLVLKRGLDEGKKKNYQARKIDR